MIYIAKTYVQLIRYTDTMTKKRLWAADLNLTLLHRFPDLNNVLGKRAAGDFFSNFKLEQYFTSILVVSITCLENFHLTQTPLFFSTKLLYIFLDSTKIL